MITAVVWVEGCVMFSRHWLVMTTCIMVSAGCASSQSVVVSNPVFVPGNNQEVVWERTVDVVHSYQFPIKREDKLDGIIETDYKVGASLLEPWHKDSRGFTSRLESSLQSIRRRAFLNVTRVEGGYLVGVEVFKELEDLKGLAANSAGAATFQTSLDLTRDLDLVVGETAPSGWLPQGRDAALEQAFLRRLRGQF